MESDELIEQRSPEIYVVARISQETSDVVAFNCVAKPLWAKLKTLWPSDDDYKSRCSQGRCTFGYGIILQDVSGGLTYSLDEVEMFLDKCMPVLLAARQAGMEIDIDWLLELGDSCFLSYCPSSNLLEKAISCGVNVVFTASV